MKRCLAMITMNAGHGILGSTIRETLDSMGQHFHKIIIVDGDIKEEAREFYRILSNCCLLWGNSLVVVDSPWKDSYVDQYKAWTVHVDDGDWVLYLDCDEVPSMELAEFIYSEEFDELSKDYNTLCLPCVLHLEHDGKYYPAEGPPKKKYEGQWFKNILLKKDQTLQFKHFGSHVIPNHGAFEKGHYVPYPYYHMKSLESFVYNDVWQAYLSPEGQQYTPADAAMFKMFTQQYKTTKDFKKATREGNWTPPLVKFAWDRRWQYQNPVSRLAWVYFVLEGHTAPATDSDLCWDEVKQYVLGEDKMKLLKENVEKENHFKWT